MRVERKGNRIHLISSTTTINMSREQASNLIDQLTVAYIEAGDPFNTPVEDYA